MKLFILLTAFTALMAEPNPKDLRLDQVDPTDSLAIPLDMSDVEDQEQIQEGEDYIKAK
jgi:hypothetical protein